MTTTHSIELFTALNLIIVGLSHFLQPKSWVEFFSLLHSKKHAGNALNALIALGMGSLIVSFHFIWEWPKALITLYGMSQVIKGLLYLVFPSIGLASIAKVTEDKAHKFKWAGVVMVLFALFIFYMLFKEDAFSYL